MSKGYQRVAARQGRIPAYLDAGRKKRNWSGTQAFKEMYAELGYTTADSRSVWSLWENGESVPTAEQLAVIAKYFGPIPDEEPPSPVETEPGGMAEAILVMRDCAVAMRDLAQEMRDDRAERESERAGYLRTMERLLATLGARLEHLEQKLPADAPQGLPGQ